MDCKKVGGRARRGADVARAAAAVGFVLLGGWGCFVDRGGLAPSPERYTCTATLRSPAGAMAMATTDLVPFAGRDICGTSASDALAEWRRHVLQVATSDPGLMPLALSCVEDAACSDPMPLPEGMTCPMPLAGPEMPDCGAAGTRCLAIDPPTTDTGFDARIDFGTVVVGTTSPVSIARVRNNCPQPTRIHLDEALAGMDPTQFAVVANGCEPRSDEERVIGRLLEAAGTPGDQCTVDFVFRPADASSFFVTASQDLSQDTIERYRILLNGVPRAP